MLRRAATTIGCPFAVGLFLDHDNSPAHGHPHGRPVSRFGRELTSRASTHALRGVPRPASSG